MAISRSGIVAVVVFAVLVLLIVLGLFIFMIRGHFPRPLRPRHGYRTISDNSRSVDNQIIGLNLGGSRPNDDGQAGKAIGANLTTAEFVVDARVAHPAPLDPRYSCDGANASYVTTSRDKHSLDTAPVHASRRLVDRWSSKDTGDRADKTMQPKASSPPRSVRESAMIRAALKASMHGMHVSGLPAKAGPSGLTASKRLADAMASSTRDITEAAKYLYEQLTDDKVRESYSLIWHGRFEFEHSGADAPEKTE